MVSVHHSDQSSVSAVVVCVITLLGQGISRRNALSRRRAVAAEVRCVELTSRGLAATIHQTEMYIHDLPWRQFTQIHLLGK